MKRALLTFGSVAGLLAALVPAGAARADGASTYNHIFVTVEENHSFNQIIGDHNAPNINGWASTFGSATDYFGAIHPSEGNYVAMVGGNASKTIRCGPSIESISPTSSTSWSRPGSAGRATSRTCLPPASPGSSLTTSSMPPSTTAS